MVREKNRGSQVITTRSARVMDAPIQVPKPQEALQYSNGKVNYFAMEEERAKFRPEVPFPLVFKSTSPYMSICKALNPLERYFCNSECIYYFDDTKITDIFSLFVLLMIT